MILADAWHHRLLVWRRVPTASDTPPDYALGQPDLDSVGANRGFDAVASGLYWPFGIAFIDGMLLVADTGNRRVVGWRGVLGADRAFDLVLGQPTPLAREENRGGAVNARSFRWPHAIAGSGAQLFVADAGNHRILGWRPRPAGDPWPWPIRATIG